MAADSSTAYRWKLVIGVIFVVGVYVASRPLPSPFDLMIPIVVGVGLGSVIGSQRKGR